MKCLNNLRRKKKIVSYIHRLGNLEKVFTREELIDFYQPFNLIAEKRINKTATFFDKEYACCHFWMVLQKT